jgi:hypothetical protein
MTHSRTRIAQALRDWDAGLFHQGYLEDENYDTLVFKLDVDDYHGELYDTADEIVTESTAIEDLDEDYNETDPEYERVLGMYVNEYANEISMVDAIDTESDFDAEQGGIY